MQTKIYKNTFKGCSNLKYIKLPNNISAIDDCAFQNCSSLTDVTIGQSVKFIGLSAFQGATSLSSVDRFTDNDPSHTFDMIGNYAFENTGLQHIKLALRSAAIDTFWGDNCFANCINLTEVNILSANYLSKNMFLNCNNLKKITFNINKMAYTYPNVFENCSQLTYVELPSNLLFISENMFKNCSSLSALTFNDYSERNSSIKLIQKNAFYGCNNLQKIEIPASINRLDQIEDAALSNTSCRSIYLHGLTHDNLIKLNTLPSDISCGVPYTVINANQLVDILAFANYHNIPVIIITEYTCYDERDEDKSLIYISNIPVSNRKEPLSQSTLNNYKSSPIYSDLKLDNITYDTQTYNFSKYRYLMIHLCINIGVLNSSNQYKISKLGETYEKYVDGYIRKMKGSTDNGYYNDDPQYKMGAYAHQLVNIPYSNIQGDFAAATLIREWRSTFKYKFNNFINDNNVLTSLVASKAAYETNYRTISFNRGNVDVNTVKIKFYNNVYKMMFNNTYATDTGNIVEYAFYKDDNINDTQYKSLSAELLYKNPCDTIDRTSAWRLVPKHNSFIGYHFFTIYDAYNTEHKFYNTFNSVEYIDPIIYESDKDTVSNFQVGKWYYKSKELYNHAKATHTPCLFIYSMLGCGPCAIYQKHIWNNQQFQEWASKQHFYLCNIECNSQPFYDESLKFCTDIIARSAENYVKKDESKPSTDVNAFNEQFNETNKFLMTPVLVFMDSAGKTYVYTYHNIQKFIDSITVSGVIECLQRLCLYHFDNNNVSTATYTVDVYKQFDINDYIENEDNEWLIGDDVINL